MNPDHVAIAKTLLSEFPHEPPRVLADRMLFAGIPIGDATEAIARAEHDRALSQRRPRKPALPRQTAPRPFDPKFLATWTRDLESIRRILRDAAPAATEDAICSASLDAIIGRAVEVDHGRLCRDDGAGYVTFYL
jgi:hypothetical protein